MKMKILDQQTLLALNQSSVQAGRRQNLSPEQLSPDAPERSWLTTHLERAEEQEVRVCVVLDLFRGRTAWLDLSTREFLDIPEVDVSEEDWETAMCAGTPPSAP